MSTFGPVGEEFGGGGATFGDLSGVVISDVEEFGLSAAVFARNDLANPLATLENSFARKWRDPLNEAGVGSLALQNDDPNLAFCGFGNIVKFSHDEIQRWSMIVRRHDRASRAQGEEHDQITTVSGLGFASVLEEACVYPEGGAEHLPFADVRYFNFASPYLDDSSWTTPVALAEPPQPSAGVERIPITAEWPNVGAEGIWTRALVATDQHPVGNCYFRATFTVADITELAIFVLGDDEYEVWVDGLLVFDYKQPGRIRAEWPYWETQRIGGITVTPGEHLIAVRATNLPLVPPTPNNLNIGELVVAVYAADIFAENGLGALLLETNTTDWVCLDYPAEPPGFTPGEVMNILLDESQARGSLMDIGRTWTDDNDSSATPWPTTPDITIRVGLNYYNVCRQLSETYMDFDFAAHALDMSLWIEQGADVSGTAQLAGGVNLATLRHTREG